MLDGVSKESYAREFTSLWEDAVRTVYRKEPAAGSATALAADGWAGTSLTPLQLVVFVADPGRLTNRIARGQKAREKRWGTWLAAQADVFVRGDR